MKTIFKISKYYSSCITSFIQMLKLNCERFVIESLYARKAICDKNKILWKTLETEQI